MLYEGPRVYIYIGATAPSTTSGSRSVLLRGVVGTRPTTVRSTTGGSRLAVFVFVGFVFPSLVEARGPPFGSGGFSVIIRHCLVTRHLAPPGRSPAGAPPGRPGPTWPHLADPQLGPQTEGAPGMTGGPFGAAEGVLCGEGRNPEDAVETGPVLCLFVGALHLAALRLLRKHPRGFRRPGEAGSLSEQTD